LYGATRDRQNSMISLASSSDGSPEIVTYAFGTASRSGSGEGITAASMTTGCSISTDSSSNGEIR
jgi:hypothetical protein